MKLNCQQNANTAHNSARFNVYTLIRRTHTSLNLVYDNRKRDFTWFRSIQSERSFHLKLLSERVKCVAY